MRLKRGDLILNRSFIVVIILFLSLTVLYLTSIVSTQRGADSDTLIYIEKSSVENDPSTVTKTQGWDKWKELGEEDEEDEDEFDIEFDDDDK